jgi:ATP-dependent Clp protease ATP-binding subunit ClpX
MGAAGRKQEDDTGPRPWRRTKMADFEKKEIEIAEEEVFFDETEISEEDFDESEAEKKADIPKEKKEDTHEEEDHLGTVTEDIFVSEDDFDEEDEKTPVFRAFQAAEHKKTEPSLEAESEILFDEDDEEVSEDDFEEEDGGTPVKELLPFMKDASERKEETDEEDDDFGEETEVSEDDFEEDESGEDDPEEDETSDETEDFGDASDEEENRKKQDKKSASSKKEKDDDESDSEYEDVCFVCRRPESVTGKQFKLPNNICVCNDCMHKTMDAVSQFDYQGMLNPSIFHMDGVNFDWETMKEKMPNISFVNIADLQGEGGIPNKQKLKKKKKSGEKKPVIDINNIPAPHKIKEKLDEYVVGQEHAKKVISVAVYNHYKRVATNTMDEIEIEKSNMLMIGPTGSGKTYLVKTLAKLLNVPLAITDATSLTEAGYIGDDIESVVSKLLAEAENDVERAEMGIIFVDEIDKIAKKQNTTSRDVSGESVQQGMLKLLEGADVEVPVGANSKNAMVPLTTINTRNILFICGGAFPELEEVIKQRLNKQTSIGYQAELKSKYDKEKNILSKVTVEDLRKFGMIPEFLGRLPVIYTLEALTREALVKVLKEPKNAILKQYQKLLALDEVKLEFEDEALEAIAEKALEKETGARALRAIIEDFMLDIMYEIPKDENIGTVTITKAYIEGTGGPVIGIRGE